MPFWDPGKKPPGLKIKNKMAAMDPNSSPGRCKVGDFAVIMRIVRLVIRENTLYYNIKEEMNFACPVRMLVGTVPPWGLVNYIRKDVMAT